MDRCRLSSELLQGVRSHLKIGDGNARVRKWVKRWKGVTLEKGELFYNGKLLVPLESTDIILRAAAQNGMPLSRDGARHWLAQRFYGFKKRHVADFLKSLEAVQLMKTRPHTKNRSNMIHEKEGSSRTLLKRSEGGLGNVGVDLVFIPRQTEKFPKQAWTKYKYLYVAVVQSTNYSFCYPMSSKTANAATSCAKKLWKDFKARYKENITGLSMDAGTEFKDSHEQFWESKGIVPKVMSKVYWVEKKNSQLMRNIAFMREALGYGWKKSFDAALEKTNGTYSRILRAIPGELHTLEKRKFFNRKLPEQPKRRKQPVFNIGDRVRHLLKSAMDVNTVLWKSYNAFRDPKTHVWSKRVHKVQNKRKKGRTFAYTVNGKDYYPWQLQKIEGEVIVLQAPVKPKKSPRKSRGPRERVAKAEISTENIRRGRRERKKTKRYGF